MVNAVLRFVWTFVSTLTYLSSKKRRKQKKFKKALVGSHKSKQRCKNTQKGIYNDDRQITETIQSCKLELWRENYSNGDLQISRKTVVAPNHFLLASMNMARVQCSISSDCDGGGGKVGCSTRSHPSTRDSFFPESDNSVEQRELVA